MKNNKNVSNKDIVNSLLKSILYNDDAIDYIKNQITISENILGYKPEDLEVQQNLKIQRFIKFQLEFINDCYEKSLKKFGVNV